MAVPGRFACDGVAPGAAPNDASPLELLSYPLLPADPARRGQVVEASAEWRFEPAAFDSEAAAAVWGRTPDSSSPLRTAMLAAGAREAVLRTMHRRIPAHLRLVAVHRLPPRRLMTTGLHGSVGAAVRGGALVELTSLPAGERVLDKALSSAQVTSCEPRFHAGTGGAMLIRGTLRDGSRVILRLARTGAPGDPTASANTLDALARDGVPLIPRPIARGHSAGASWVVEHALPGRRPARATLGLLRQVATVCTTFPRGKGAPTATAVDLDCIAERLPERASAVAQLADEFAGQFRNLPSVLRHGDLWAGNILVDRGTLTGLIDWDSAHPAAVPGSDLLQLFATEFRRRARCGLGLAFLKRPWRLPMFAAAARNYWPALGIAPDGALLELVGLAWWATEVRGTLTRVPHRASDERWVTTNVDPVLQTLGYRP